MLNLLISFILMINPTTLSTRLTGLVGFRQPYNPEYQVIDAANLESRSGYYITDNPFVKIENIKDTQDFDKITDGDFNNWLRNKVATSIVNVANAVFNENDYIDRQLIYKHAANKFSTTPDQPEAQTPEGIEARVLAVPPGFQCYWFQVSQDKDIAFKIKRMLLEFNGTGTIKLYLYNTADLTTPLQTKIVTVTGPFMEVDLDWICDNTGVGYKGDYYLGYFASELTGNLQPFKRQYREAVLMSEIENLIYYRAAFGSFTDPTKAFDLMNYTIFNYYNGLNPDITVYEDFTDLIIQNEKLFARAILLDAQISFLSESIATNRSNRNERNSSANVSLMMAQIEGQAGGETTQKIVGLRPQFFGAVGSIRKELQKLRTGYSGDKQILVQTLT